MARLYFLSSTNSDLPVGTSDFARTLFYNNTAAATTASVTVAGQATEFSYGYTLPLDPSTFGTTGDYTVNVDVTTANNNIFLSIVLNRITSTGILLSSSSPSAENNISTIGIKTFNFTNINLGNWAAGDRFALEYAFRNSAMNNQTCAIAVNDPDTNIITPFTVRSFVVT